MNGIILFHKPEGITSFGAVARVRRVTGEKKIGHTGTLDPMATGVLPILLGGATRFASLLPDHSKAYLATFRLGLTTDTLDITGAVTATAPVTATAADVQTALQAFLGTQMQVPPMYSALMRDGVRLYDLARQGIEVEREAREITIDAIDLVCVDEETHTYQIAVACSAGTYIRSLVDDLGKKLGCGATLTALCRTRANSFLLEQCFTLEDLEEKKAAGLLEEALLPLEDALPYPAITVTAPQANRFQNGGCLELKRLKAVEGTGYFKIFDPNQVFLGLGEVNTETAQMDVKRLYVRR